MQKPTFEKFGLTEDEYHGFLERNKKVSLVLTHYLPLSAGAVLGVLIYIIYYRPFASPDWFQLVISVFVFGGFGVLFLGLPLVFFRVVEKIYYRILAKKSERYRSVVDFDEQVEKYDYWRLRTDEDLWKGMHLTGFRTELERVFINLGYQSIKLDGRNETHREFDFLLYKDYRLIPVKCFSQEKMVSVSYILKLNKVLDSLQLKHAFCASTSGFTRRAAKFVSGKDIKLLSPKQITEMMKET